MSRRLTLLGLFATSVVTITCVTLLWLSSDLHWLATDEDVMDTMVDAWVRQHPTALPTAPVATPAPVPETVAPVSTVCKLKPWLCPTADNAVLAEGGELSAAAEREMTGHRQRPTGASSREANDTAVDLGSEIGRGPVHIGPGGARIDAVNDTVVYLGSDIDVRVLRCLEAWERRVFFVDYFGADDDMPRFRRFGQVATCAMWPPVQCGHLCDMASSAIWPPVRCGHLCDAAACAICPLIRSSSMPACFPASTRLQKPSGRGWPRLTMPPASPAPCSSASPPSTSRPHC